MLIHLTPKILMRHPKETCRLLDFSCEDFNLQLIGGRDIIANRPYANKLFQVVAPANGHNGINGILVDALGPASKFTTVTRWELSAGHIVSHIVNYQISDYVYDTASTEVALWYPKMAEGIYFEPRRPVSGAAVTTPLAAVTTPLMETCPSLENPGVIRRQDVVDEKEGLVERHEDFTMPTIQRQRLTSGAYIPVDQLPTTSSCFYPYRRRRA